MLVYQRVYIHISGFSGCVTCHPACVWRDCLVFCVFLRSNLRLVVIVTIPFLPSLGENPWRIIPGIMPRQGCHGLNIPFKAPENHGFSGSSDGFFGFFCKDYGQSCHTFHDFPEIFQDVPFPFRKTSSCLCNLRQARRMSWLRRGEVFVCLRMRWAMNQIAWLIGYPPRDLYPLVI